jgi:pantoate--beta-alanine ligase
MITVHSIDEVRKFVSQQRKNGNTIGFVPTMGALHAGHLSLVEASKKKNKICVMSIFVNPTQFGPNEDFTKYPRPVQKDQELAIQAGVDLLFLPTVETMYPETEKTVYVEEMVMSTVLCGKYRPGHFRGVCTVVNKLLNIVTPDHLYLGEKDAQQFRILQKMVSELQMPVNVIGVPILREKNGLAMSSRNRYLSTEYQDKASVIFRALSAAKKEFDNGERNVKKLVHAAHTILETEPLLKIQYLEIRTWNDLKETNEISQPSLLAIACHMGDIRLIDNVIFSTT